MIVKNVEAFDGISWHPRVYEMISDVLKSAKKANSIGEFGCGTGRMAYTLAKRFKKKHFMASDVDERFIRYAKRKYRLPNLKYHVLNVEKMNLREEFDFVYTIYLLHHLKDQRKGVKKVYNSLKDKGLWLIVEPNSFNPLVFLFQKLIKEDIFRPNLISRLKLKVMRKGFFFSSLNVDDSLGKFFKRMEKFPLFGGSLYLLIKRS